jgi:hypothetical protein
MRLCSSKGADIKNSKWTMQIQNIVGRCTAIIQPSTCDQETSNQSSRMWLLRPNTIRPTTQRKGEGATGIWGSFFLSTSLSIWRLPKDRLNHDTAGFRLWRTARCTFDRTSGMIIEAQSRRHTGPKVSRCMRNGWFSSLQWPNRLCVDKTAFS